jgi:GNAT superfamily N-acetyltransferase
VIEGSEVEVTDEVTIDDVRDERDPIAHGALKLIERSFPPRERQPLAQIAMEVAEKRLGLLTSPDFHLLAATSSDGAVMGIASGVYLGGLQSGFISYLAVDPDYRDLQLGKQLRARLVDAFRQDADDRDHGELKAVVGEVRLDSPWLQRLVRDRAVLPLDFDYYHAGEDPSLVDSGWILYREPIGDERMELPVGELRQLLYAIWRRAYRMRWPLDSPAFKVMLEELEGRDMIGAHAALELE